MILYTLEDLKYTIACYINFDFNFLRCEEPFDRNGWHGIGCHSFRYIVKARHEDFMAQICHYYKNLNERPECIKH